MEAVYLKRGEFQIKKFKMDKDSMLVDFVEKRETNEGLVKIPHSMDPPYQAHPDLNDLLSRMKDFVLKQYDYHRLYASRGKDAKEIKKEWIDLNDRLTVTGFSISGSENLRGAVITAKLKTDSGTRAMPTGRIVFESDKLGYEKEVEVLIDELENEIYECLFKEKRAQLNLFNEEPKVKEMKVGLVS